MNEEVILNILEQLKNKEIEEYVVQKEDFLPFRALLVKREDFKQFLGIAERGGSTRYSYMDNLRS